MRHFLFGRYLSVVIRFRQTPAAVFGIRSKSRHRYVIQKNKPRAGGLSKANCEPQSGHRAIGKIQWDKDFLWITRAPGALVSIAL